MSIESEEHPPQGPLSGLRVLDFTWALAGPFGTMQLADLGAEVVKIEHPRVTEKQRGFGPYYEGISTFLFSVNRGKQGICIDLKDTDGRELAKKLAGKADILVENFRPGTMEKLGLDYDTLHLEYPQLIYAALSGFGQTGPYKNLSAVDAVAQAMGGTMSLNGEMDAPPMRVGVSIGDMVGGLYLALGILAAVHSRKTTGKGQLLDIALMEAQIALCENAIVRHSAFNESPSRQGSRHALLAPFGPFETADGYLVVANVKDWEMFCALIERDDLGQDERFISNQNRLENIASLEYELTRTLKEKTTDAWFQILKISDCCSIGKVNNIPDLFTDEHVQDRNALVDIPLPYGKPGTLKLPNTPIKLSETPATIKGPMPEHGGDTNTILETWLGLSTEEIASLKEKGAIK
ncbi:MAG: CaiB/BaiF CoA transferase family protein [Tepidiformaceae bacterium]